jgi:hypothetical protein
VANDAMIFRRDERRQHGAFVSQAVYKVCFFRAPKSRFIYGAHGADVVGTFPTNNDVLSLHPGKLSPQASLCGIGRENAARFPISCPRPGPVDFDRLRSTIKLNAGPH